MNKQLVKKFFKDQCTPEELKQVLAWFKTDEGQRYLAQDIEEETRRFADNDNKMLYPQIDGEKIFSRIQLNKKRDASGKHRVYLRVASIVVAAALLSLLLYWSGLVATYSETAAPELITYQARQGQHKIISLPGGTNIRLNEGTKLIVPKEFSEHERRITLTGEAYFEVAHDASRPFIVSAEGAMVRVLGTKFNVKTDTAHNTIQVAVVSGKVSLQEKGAKEDFGAILTRNTFGVLDLFSNEIIIEKTTAANYLSWVNGRLKFNGMPLWKVSRQLERIYDTSISFKNEQLENLKLTADFDKENAETTLSIIANTLGIHMEQNDTSYVWMN